MSSLQTNQDVPVLLQPYTRGFRTLIYALKVATLLTAGILLYVMTWLHDHTDTASLVDTPSGLLLFLTAFVALVWSNTRLTAALNKEQANYALSLKILELCRTSYYASEKEVRAVGVTEKQYDTLGHPCYMQYLQNKENSSDMGAMILLRNEHGITTRVIVPNKSEAAYTIRRLVDKFWRNIPSSQFPLFGGYTMCEIFNLRQILMRKTSDSLAPNVLDQIAISCDKPYEERSGVRVYGKELEPGVVFATALEFEGILSIFVPTGYVKMICSQAVKIFAQSGGATNDSAQATVAT